MVHLFKLRCLPALAMAAFISVSQPGVAQVTDVLPQAQALMAQGQWQEAFKLLEPSELQRAGDPAFDMAIGTAANGAAQYMRAILAFERVLAVQPNNAQAHAELGRALFAVGDTVGARRELNESKRLGATGQLVVAVDSILQSMDRAEAVNQSSLRGYVEASLGHDSNANTAPGSPNVPVPSFGGLVFTLDPEGVQTPSAYGTVGNGLMGRYVITPELSLIGNAHGQIRKHANPNTAFNSERASVQAGINFRQERHELTLARTIDVSRLNNALSRKQSGVVGEWTNRIDQYQQLSFFFQLLRLTHPDDQSARDAKRQTYGGSYAHTFRNDLTVYGGAFGGSERVERTDLPHLGHRFMGLRFGAQQPITESVVAFGSLSYEDRLYGDIEPSFLVVRRDKQTNLGFGLHWVPEKFWRVTPQVSLAHTQSNVIINEYDKRVISVTARREF